MFDALGIPVVTLERDAAHPERRWWVAGDNIPNTYALLDHLAQAGARSIALFTVAKAWSWFAEVEAAYRDWTARAGLPAIVEAVPGGTRYSSLVAAAGRLLEVASAGRGAGAARAACLRSARGRAARPAPRARGPARGGRGRRP